MVHCFETTKHPLSPTPLSPAGYNQDLSRIVAVPTGNSNHPQLSPANFVSGDKTRTGDEAIPTAVGGSKPLSDNSLRSIGDNGDDSLGNSISRLQAAQTWAECEAVWGKDTELKDRIKAALPREELVRIGKLFKSAQEAEAQKSPPPPIDIDPIDAEKMRDIANIFWTEYYPEHIQSLITQMFGRQSPGTKYSQEIIYQWL
ncbi:MAG: hypothetical protein U7126_19525 [Microcoleus sp.]